MDENEKAKPELKFDLSKFTARDVRDLNRALAAADTESAAKLFARVCSECPSAWGKPDDPETYLGLQYPSQFNMVTRSLIAQVQNDAKN